MGGLRFTFLQNILCETFSKSVQAEELAKKLNKKIGFTHPFKFGIASLFNLMTAVFISEIGHFSSWTAALSMSMEIFPKQSWLAWIHIFHFSFQDFLSKSHPNFEVIMIEIKFDSVCECFSDCSWMLIEKNYRVSRAKFKSKINLHYKT